MIGEGLLSQWEQNQVELFGSLIHDAFNFATVSCNAAWKLEGNPALLEPSTDSHQISEPGLCIIQKE